MARLTPAPQEQSSLAGALGQDDWSDLRVRVLGVDGRVGVRGGNPGLLIEARQRLTELDERWGAAHPDSLVAQIEANPGQPVPVDDATFDLVLASREAAQVTAGAVGSEGVHLDAQLTRITLAPDGVLDVDDLARARAVDEVAHWLLEAGAEGAVVALGGTRRFGGSPGGAHAWVAHVHDPDDPDRVVARLGLVEGAVVTVDRPTRELRSLTVLGEDAEAPGVLAAAADLDLLAADGAPALAVLDDGTTRTFGDLDRYLLDPPSRPEGTAESTVAGDG